MHLRAPATSSADYASTNMMAGLASILAEQEIETLRGRILPNLEMAARSGRRGGRVPLGYRREPDGRISVEPHDAAILTRCVAAVLSGIGVSKQVHQLAKDGVRDQAGHELSFDRVRGALTNEFCQGELVWRLPAALRKGETEVRIRQHHPVLIDPVTFAALQEKLRALRGHGTPSVGAPAVGAPATRRRARARAARLPQNGDLVAALTPAARPVHGAVSPSAAQCGHCSGVMYAVLQTVGGVRNRRRVPIYQCRRHKDLGTGVCPQPPIAANIVDEAVFTAVKRQLRAQEHRNEVQEPRTTPAATAAHTAELAVAEAECARMRPISDTLGTTAPQVLRDRLAKAEALVAHLKTVLQRSSATRSQPNGPLWEFRRQPQVIWDRLDAAGRRAVLASLLRCVMIKDKEVVSIDFMPVDEPVKTARDDA